ncbi:hypothetical protein J6590_075567 [Homalodisca vitripennis]|nr:hypothetical protein J6590_075567 [Homalodisca vitripennis]
MESLLSEVLDKISEYLTPYELAACSGVSVGWRDAFNQDSLWRPHCNKDTAEYLETADSRVEPRFESPESEDSTLSPVCRWRMCYMRETHLRSNWRHGRSVKDKIHTVEDIQNKFCMFVSDDYVLLSSGRKVMLWNVRGSPVYIGEPIHLLFESEGIMLAQMINTNMVLIVQGLSVQVYCFKSILDKTWELKHVFLFDETQSVSSSEEVSLMAVRNKNPIFFEAPIAVGNIFIGYSLTDLTVLHIWNVEEGKKLKTVECKTTSASFYRLWTIVKSEKPSLDIVVVLWHRSNLKDEFHVYIYSLKHLDFLPFHETYYMHNNLATSMKCVLHDRFLAVKVNNKFFIYNYVTSQLVHTIPVTTDCGLVAVNNHILFTEQRKFYKIFNTNTLEIKNIRVTNNTKVPPVHDFGKVLFGNFFYTSGFLTCAQVWEVGRNPMAGEVTWIKESRHIKHSKINRSNTKSIYVPHFSEQYFTCKNFW